MRTFAAKLHTSFQSAYAMLFNELLYKHRIGLKMRGKKPYVQWLKPEEYRKAYQSVAALWSGYSGSVCGGEDDTR